MATDKPAQIDEERRLLHVAMTRAKQHLHLVQPLRFFRAHQHRFGSGHTIAPRSRFLPDDILPLFTRRPAATPEAAGDAPVRQPVVRVDIGARLRGMWG
jgi:DNA helicase-2/ATP-dependent DNA helicase PcrA